MTLRLLLIGDVGDPLFHVGDEAMFETALLELRRRGDVEITCVTSGPDVIRERYGVKAVRQLGFDPRRGPAHDPGRDARLQALFDRSDTSAEAREWWHAVDHADAVLVTGGGNINASWPHLVYERIALLQAALAGGVPSVLVGQTIGPRLSRRQEELLAPLLATARLVGVRDVESRALVQRMSPDAAVLVHADDAIGLPSGATWPGAPASYVTMSIHPVEQPDTDALHEALATMACALRDTSGCEVVVLPNTGSLAGDTAADSDATFAAGWAARHASADGIHLAPTLSSRAFAATVRGSRAVVSSRFHPIVFATGADVPAIGLTSDRYTAQKLRGALAHVGLGEWCLPFSAVGTATPRTTFTELIERRDELATHMSAVTGAWPALHERRWDLVWRCLEGRPTPDLESLSYPEVRPLPPTTASDVLNRLEMGRYTREERLLETIDTTEEYALSLEHTLHLRSVESENRHQLLVALQQELDALRSTQAHT